MNRRLYWIWAAMRDRCRNPNSRQYADYRQVHKRVAEYGWTTTKALTTPIRGGRYAAR